jgi:hypothetical protein
MRLQGRTTGLATIRYAAANECDKKQQNKLRMKQILMIILMTMTLCSHGQDKYNYVQYNKLTEVKGTEFVIASIENYGKGIFAKGEHLLFINTKNGQSKQTDFTSDAQIYKVEQIKIDSLKIHGVLVAAKTVNLNGDKGIGWKDPEQIFIYSPDGQKQAQLTDNKFFSRTWAVNNSTGTIVITGHYDTNNNGEYDKTDKNEILIFDLRTYKLVNKI